MIAYKVLHRRKDGTLGSLFVDGSRRIPQRRWVVPDETLTPSWLAHLPGWHCHTRLREAHKLCRNGKNRVLFQVKVRGIRRLDPNGRLVCSAMKLEEEIYVP